MKEYRMKYRQYKERYADCGTVGGSYDKSTKTILVLIPEGRMKASGTRGQRYNYYRFAGREIETGRAVAITVKAICLENAQKQLARDYPGCTF